MKLIINLYIALVSLILESFGIESSPVLRKSATIKESKNLRFHINLHKKFPEINLESIFISGIAGNNDLERSKPDKANQPQLQEQYPQKVENSSTIDFNNLKNLKEYKKYMNRTRSNTKNLTHSRSFYDIINKVIEFFPKHLTKQDADLEILRLRNSNVDEVTEYFVNLNINSTSEYWYFYYILSNVALRGKIVGINKANDWKKNYPDDLLEQENSDDKFYLDLKTNQDHNFNQTLAHCKTNVLAEIWHIVQEDIKKQLKVKSQYYQSVLEQWLGYIKNISKLSFSDFTYRSELIYEIEKLESYKLIKNNLPKGVIHHVHLTACFSNFREIIEKVFSPSEGSFKDFIIVQLHEEDRIYSGKFLSVGYPKFIFIEDLVKVIYSANEYTEKLFTDNFLLPDGRCVVVTDKTRNIPLNSNLLALYYLKYCKSKTFYSIRLKEIKQELVSKGFINERLLNKISSDLKVLPRRLFFISKLSDVESIVTSPTALPNSYLKYLTSKKDMLSNSIWFKFESIFGLYENIFDNPVIVKELLKYLANIFAEQKIYGVEFRQKFDISKGENSKAKAIREEFKLKNILTSFILPGRKTLANNGLEATMKQLNQINETDVAGVDFVGYEDDPFTGARNFFPNTLQKIFDNQKKQDFDPLLNTNNTNNSTNSENAVSVKKQNIGLFELFFDSLKRGNKLYLHAGETLYFPNYSIDEEFMKEFYINDNLIHAALLPNVERLGHGFAVINNELLLSIFKRKNIGLEICPISNQLLYYHNVEESPFLNLLRKGIKVSISPDDPGFFGYTGVAMDWFFIMMQTDIKLSEIYLVLKNSILKASPNIYKQKDYLIEKLQKDLTEFIKIFKCKDVDVSVLNLNQTELDARYVLKSTREHRMTAWIKRNLKVDPDRDPVINVYDKDGFIRRIKRDLNMN